MPGLRQTTAFRTDRDAHGRPLTAAERERLVKPYLPQPPQPDEGDAQTDEPSARSKRFVHRPRIRPALRQLLHFLLFTLIHAVFSVYIRVRKVYHAIHDRLLAILHYHFRAPELIRRDVKRLSKVPQHLSVILELPPEGGQKDRLETLVGQACEVAAWSACAGVPMLSIYERTGALKSSLPNLHRRISKTLTSYYGTSSMKPTLSLRAPHSPSYSPPHSPEPSNHGEPGSPGHPHLTVLLIDSADGRQTLVDLTRTLASMAQDHKLAPSDISQGLIDVEISESVMGEPDLLILFGDRIVLDGYPPWQIRLTEIYGVQDNDAGVNYTVFLRALYRYSKAEMRFGR